MAKQSAGILMYRFRHHLAEVLLVHPGGPFWRNKDEGAWSIPKGELAAGDDPLTTAIREFGEETGFEPRGTFKSLSPLKQKSGKIIHAWMLEGDLDTDNIISNSFELEWPPRSGKKILVPEVDRAAWYGLQDAEKKIIPGQAPFLRELASKLGF